MAVLKTVQSQLLSSRVHRVSRAAPNKRTESHSHVFIFRGFPQWWLQCSRERGASQAADGETWQAAFYFFLRRALHCSLSAASSAPVPCALCELRADGEVAYFSPPWLSSR